MEQGLCASSRGGGADSALDPTKARRQGQKQWPVLIGAAATLEQAVPRRRIPRDVSLGAHAPYGGIYAEGVCCHCEDARAKSIIRHRTNHLR